MGEAERPGPEGAGPAAGPATWDPFTAEAAIGDDAYRAAKGAHLRARADAPDAPVVVWAMGKSGTTAVADALRRAGVPTVFHVHNLLARSLGVVEKEYIAQDPQARPTHIWDAQVLIMFRPPTPEVPWTVVTLVRDPLAVSVAAFFQAATRRGLLGPGATVETLRAAFRWNPPLDWFDVQMPTVDIYSHPFDPTVGHATITLEDEPVRLLVLRQEDLGAPRTAEVLAAHVGTPRPVELKPVNVGAQKHYADLYRAFREEVRPPADVVERVCASRLVQHFYAPDEIAALRTRWS